MRRVLRIISRVNECLRCRAEEFHAASSLLPSNVKAGCNGNVNMSEARTNSCFVDTKSTCSEIESRFAFLHDDFHQVDGVCLTGSICLNRLYRRCESACCEACHADKRSARHHVSVPSMYRVLAMNHSCETVIVVGDRRCR